MAWVDPERIPPALWEQMNITKERFAEVMAMMEERERTAPPVGSLAPDFALRRVLPDRRLSSERIRLSELRGRPSALVFGSFT